MGAGALGRLGPALDHEDGELDVGKMSRSDLLRYAEKNGATAPVVDVLRVRADVDGSVALHMAPAQLDPRMSARERVQVVGALSRLRCVDAVNGVSLAATAALAVEADGKVDAAVAAALADTHEELRGSFEEDCKAPSAGRSSRPGELGPRGREQVMCHAPGHA